MDAELRKINSAVWAGYAAMLHVTDPQRWIAFAAWAEQNMPGTTWDERDRLLMRADADLLRILAEECEGGS